jgi:hypothetical protein
MTSDISSSDEAKLKQRRPAVEEAAAASPSSVAQPQPAPRRQLAPVPPRWSYTTQACVGIFIVGLTLFGYLSVAPGFVPLLRLLGAGGVADSYGATLDKLDGAHVVNASAMPSVPTAWWITHDPSRDWTGLLGRKEENPPAPGTTSYVMPNWIDKAVPMFFISVIIEFFIATRHSKKKMRLSGDQLEGPTSVAGETAAALVTLVSFCLCKFESTANNRLCSADLSFRSMSVFYAMSFSMLLRRKLLGTA